MFWAYDKDQLPECIPLSHILEGCASKDAQHHFIFSAFQQATASPVGKNLMDDVAQAGCHIAIVPELPFLGLSIPAGQGPDHLAAPLILMSGDAGTWKENQVLALFVGLHESFHIVQDKNKVLNVPCLAGVKYQFSSDIPQSQYAECTIMTERSADLAATVGCLTVPEKAVQHIEALQPEPSLSNLLIDCHVALGEGQIDLRYLTDVVRVDAIDNHALRYYSRYTHGLSRPTILGDFYEAAASEQVARKNAALVQRLMDFSGVRHLTK